MLRVGLIKDRFDQMDSPTVQLKGGYCLQKSNRQGFLIIGLISVALVALKLANAIDASWLIVLLPIWLPLAIAAIGSLIMTIGMWLGRIK